MAVRSLPGQQVLLTYQHIITPVSNWIDNRMPNAMFLAYLFRRIYIRQSLHACSSIEAAFIKHFVLIFQALVHVSTAYCNCERERVEETVYAPPAHPEHVVTLVQTLPDDLVDRITPDLVGEFLRIDDHGV